MSSPKSEFHVSVRGRSGLCGFRMGLLNVRKWVGASKRRSMLVLSLACQARRTSLARVSPPLRSSYRSTSHPSFICLLQPVLYSETFNTLSLLFLSYTLPTLLFFVLSVLFLATLPSPCPLENVIKGPESWWWSGFRHNE